MHTYSALDLQFIHAMCIQKVPVLQLPQYVSLRMDFILIFHCIHFSQYKVSGFQELSCSL